MGWAKFEEDNREAWTDRYTSGNFFWDPYKDYSAGKLSSYDAYIRKDFGCLPCEKQKRDE